MHSVVLRLLSKAPRPIKILKSGSDNLSFGYKSTDFWFYSIDCSIIQSCATHIYAATFWWLVLHFPLCPLNWFETFTQYPDLANCPATHLDFGRQCNPALHQELQPKHSRCARVCMCSLCLCVCMWYSLRKNFVPALTDWIFEPFPQFTNQQYKFNALLHWQQFLSM